MSDEYDDLEIVSKPSSLANRSKVNISNAFYDMVEAEWGFEAPVTVEYVSPTHYFLKVASVHFVYHIATHRWNAVDRYS